MQDRVCGRRCRIRRKIKTTDHSPPNSVAPTNIALNFWWQHTFTYYWKADCNVSTLLASDNSRYLNATRPVHNLGSPFNNQFGVAHLMFGRRHSTSIRLNSRSKK
jgi:hypothetical protein